MFKLKEYRHGASLYARRVRKDAWEKHKPLLLKLHRDGKTRAQMLEALRDQGFEPSSGQLIMKLKMWKLTVYKSRAHGILDDQLTKIEKLPVVADPPDPLLGNAQNDHSTKRTPESPFIGKADHSSRNQAGGNSFRLDHESSATIVHGDGADRSALEWELHHKSQQNASHNTGRERSAQFIDFAMAYRGDHLAGKCSCRALFFGNDEFVDAFQLYQGVLDETSDNQDSLFKLWALLNCIKTAATIDEVKYTNTHIGEALQHFRDLSKATHIRKLLINETFAFLENVWKADDEIPELEELDCRFQDDYVDSDYWDSDSWDSDDEHNGSHNTGMPERSYRPLGYEQSSVLVKNRRLLLLQELFQRLCPRTFWDRQEDIHFPHCLKSVSEPRPWLESIDIHDDLKLSDPSLLLNDGLLVHAFRNSMLNHLSLLDSMFARTFTSGSEDFIWDCAEGERWSNTGVKIASVLSTILLISWRRRRFEIGVACSDAFPVACALAFSVVADMSSNIKNKRPLSTGGYIPILRQSTKSLATELVFDYICGGYIGPDDLVHMQQNTTILREGYANELRCICVTHVKQLFRYNKCGKLSLPGICQFELPYNDRYLSNNAPPPTLTDMLQENMQAQGRLTLLQERYNPTAASSVSSFQRFSDLTQKSKTGQRTPDSGRPGSSMSIDSHLSWRLDHMLGVRIADELAVTSEERMLVA